MSDIASANRNYRYLLVCIDVFSRLAFVVPMRNKTTEMVVECFKEIIDKVSPSIINCDNGSEFTSHAFKELINRRGIIINYVNVSDHHKLGTVDRFVRTLREKLNKYMSMYNTTKYIDVLPKIVNNYNTAYHSGIKKAPNEVKDEDEEEIELTRRKYIKAKKEEQKFNIGDKVRHILNKKQFDKGTLAQFSKMVHKIISQTEHTYTLDNGNMYKYYELQKVDNVHTIPNTNIEPTREQLKKKNTIKRKLNNEGIDQQVINEKRARTSTDRFHY